MQVAGGFLAREVHKVTVTFACPLVAGVAVVKEMIPMMGLAEVVLAATMIVIGSTVGRFGRLAATRHHHFPMQVRGTVELSFPVIQL